MFDEALGRSHSNNFCQLVPFHLGPFYYNSTCIALTAFYRMKCLIGTRLIGGIELPVPGPRFIISLMVLLRNSYLTAELLPDCGIPTYCGVKVLYVVSMTLLSAPEVRLR